MKQVKNQFCCKCGIKLELTFVDKHYDSYSGEELYNIIWACPKWGWFFSSHTRFKSDHNGYVAHEY